MLKHVFPIFACAIALTFSTPMRAAELSDCSYKGAIAGRTATIGVKSGQPVSYKWGSYRAKSVSQSGSTIVIDQASIKDVKAGATQSGKPAFQGTWDFQGKKSPVTFICN
ncbi:hypothetical protein [Sulfitobacter noctilucae]|uniref:hypothetical protein n=1 Tax=Sulfitobacter noctilucae TaxID=1342302 RepID=UPI00046A33BC|nr:hypothetical protein [Sulfitobacter noctilucae]